MAKIEADIQKMSNNLPWQKTVAQYAKSHTWCSAWQITNSLIPFLLLWAAMAFSLQVSYWLTLLLAIPAAGFMVRLFIIFHDCGHGSFFKSRQLNDLFGILTGILTLTPYYHWRHNHAIHHATAGDLDRRGVGDVWTLTVSEYQSLPKLKQIAYRIARNPLIMFTVGSLGVFLIGHRFSTKGVGKKERYSVYWTNLALLGIGVLLSLTIGFKALLLVELPILILATSSGVWLFYVQHQFDGVYWERHNRWDFASAGLKGCSFYKLPRVLQWFTGNIGFHHVHHLNPRIPNYLLEKCHNANPLFQHVKTLTLLSSLKSLFLNVYDESQHNLVSFRSLKKGEKSFTPG